MATGKPRKRIEIDEELYWELDREARWLHMPVTACASMLIKDGLSGRTSAGSRALSPRSADRRRGLEASDIDRLEYDHSPAAIAELRAPVRHPERGSADGG